MTSRSTAAQHGLCVTVVMVRSRLLLSVDGDIEIAGGILWVHGDLVSRDVDEGVRHVEIEGR